MNKYQTYKPSGIDWIGEIPVHWEVKRLKDVAEVKFSSIDKHSYDDEESVKLCNYVDVYKHEFINSSISFMNGSASESEYEKLKLQKGDVLATKDSETPQDIAVPALVNEDLNNVVCSYHLALIRPHNKIAGSYLFRLFQTKPINAHFEVSANGITRYGLGVDSFTSLRVFIPPIQEQRSIASYLDEQTQKIDKLVANKKAQVERLRELRQIEINNAVVKGMNPNAPMKESGIERLGKIPEHWGVKRLKDILIDLKSGEGFSANDLEDEAAFEVFGGNGVLGYINKFNFDGKAIVIGRVGAKCGNINIIEGKKWISDNALFCYTHQHYEFVYYLLEAMNLNQYSNQNAQPLITGTIVRYLKFALPPKDEQLQIANHLQQRTAAIDKLTKNTESQILKLQELRKIKIYEAVTGKLKCHA